MPEHAFPGPLSYVNKTEEAYDHRRENFCAKQTRLW